MLFQESSVAFKVLVQLPKPLMKQPHKPSRNLIRQWRADLGLKTSQIKAKEIFGSKSSKEGRLELRPLNAQGRKLHAFLYAMVTLLAR